MFFKKKHRGLSKNIRKLAGFRIYKFTLYRRDTNTYVQKTSRGRTVGSSTFSLVQELDRLYYMSSYSEGFEAAFEFAYKVSRKNPKEFKLTYEKYRIY